MKVVCVENPQKKYLKNAMQDKRNLMNLLLVNGISQSTEAGPLFNWATAFPKGNKRC